MSETQVIGLDTLIRNMDATRRILDDPETAQATLRDLLEGKSVKGSDAAPVVAALLQCALDFQWPAKRYAHGRSTYAVGMVNDATKLLQVLGVKVSPTDGTVWARDGSFGWPNYAATDPDHKPVEDR